LPELTISPRFWDVVGISVIGAPDLGHRTASMHVRLQMLWDDLTGIRTGALARLSVGVSLFDGVAFDQEDGLTSAEVDVGRREVFKRGHSTSFG
jgi:hypothetical protein